MSFLTIKTGECLTCPEKTPIKFPYEPDHFQKHAYHSIENNENVLVSVPTGAGKTDVAKYAIAKTIQNDGIVVITTPVKALSNEKYKQFSEIFDSKFTDETGLTVSIGLLTGDNKINPEGNCLIMTAEILRNALFNIKNKLDTALDPYSLNQDIISKIKCVVMDEVHFINDPDRGTVWEQTIILLPQHIQLVMLSATVDKPHEFAEWIGNCKQKPISLILGAKRPVPLEHFIFSDNQTLMILDEHDNYNSFNYSQAKSFYNTQLKEREKKHKDKVNFNLVPNLVQYLKRKNLLQAIFFSFSRKKCEEYALMITDSLIDHYERSEIEAIFSRYLHPYHKQYELLDQYNLVQKLFSNGVAFHHSGLIPILKEITEILFSKGLIKVLFATETFAVGVNMPTKTVVFTELEKYTKRGKRFINTAEYKQMAGRAGRRGLDTNGYAIILPLYSFPEEYLLKNVITGKVPHIESKFKLDYSLILKCLQSESTNLSQLLDNSLFNKETKIMIQNTKEEIQKLQLSIVKPKLSQDILNKFQEFYELDNIDRQSMGMFRMTRSKQQERRYTELKKEIQKLHKFDYEKFLSYHKQLDNIQLKQNYVLSLEQYFIQTSQSIIQFLQTYNFITPIIKDEETGTFTELTYKNLTHKGVIAGQINECNGIILAEMLVSKMFHGLTPQEIVGLCAIFTDDSDNTMTSLLEVKSSIESENIIKVISQLQLQIEDIKKQEEILQLKNYDYWNISLAFIQPAYVWASGGTIHQALDSYLLEPKYEGNFIKSMLKIHNIIHDIKVMVGIIGLQELLPALELTDELIIRDVVNVNSLYLSK